MTDNELRAALYGRTLTTIARDTGISYDALYRFMGKPLHMFDRLALIDYLERLAGGESAGQSDGIGGQSDAGDDSGTWAQVAAAIGGAL